MDGLDPVLLWLWHRLTAAAAIRPLAWELPYATSAALKKQKKKKERKKKEIMGPGSQHPEVEGMRNGQCQGSL